MKAFTKTLLGLMLVSLVAFGVSGSLSLAAHATGPWYVRPDGNDSNSCASSVSPCASISVALYKAAPGDTILVAAGVYTGTTYPVVLLNKNIILSGGWDNSFTAQTAMSIIDGQGARRVVAVNSGVTAAIERLVIQNGNAGYSYDGGGILNQGILTVTSSIIQDSWATYGGGVSNSGGTLRLNYSTIRRNTSTAFGGGILNDSGPVARSSEVLFDKDDATDSCPIILNHSSVSGNASDAGAGIFNNWTCLALNNSTIDGNSSSGNGGGVHSNFTLILNNSTISSNAAAGSGGGISFNGSLYLNNSTVSQNVATYGNGGGVSHFGGEGGTLQNSIVAENTAASRPDCSGQFYSGGYNLIENVAGCTLISTTGDLTNVEPLLGPLYGTAEVPKYHRLQAGSPAIDGGNPAGCTDQLGNPLLADQRGALRVGRCDIGAYELTPLDYSIKVVTPTIAKRGDLLTYTIALNNILTDTSARLTDTLPVDLSFINDSLGATSGSYGYAGGVITWSGMISVGGAVTITFEEMINQTAPLSASIDNSAIISDAWMINVRTATVHISAAVTFLPCIFRTH